MDFLEEIAYTLGKENKDTKEGGLNMELAKITSKGQITIPIQVRKRLNLKEGDKVAFITEGNRIILENSTKLAIKEVRGAFEGLAEELGLKTEEDVVDLVKEVRKEIWEKKYENND